MLALIVVTLVVAALAGWWYFGTQNRAGTQKSTGSPAQGSAPVSTSAPPTDTVAETGVLVLFGSQTGTAEMFAKTLAREGARLGVHTTLCDVEEYEPHLLEREKMVVIICATYGEGEPTDSMKHFHEWLADDGRQVGEELTGVKYAVFGLGDRQYKYFCEEANFVDRRMDELNAERIYGLGCGDAGQDLEEQFDEWRRDLWPALGRTLGITIKENTEEPVEPECRLKVWDGMESSTPFPRTTSVLEPSHKLPAWVPIVENKDLLNNCQDRCTRNIAFDISDTIISYQSGDHLGILPYNRDDLVDEYLTILGVGAEQAEQVISLQDKKTLKNVYPARVSVRLALKWYVDLAGPPKKSTLRAFAHYCTDPWEKESLLKILRVSHEAQTEFAKLSGKLRTVYGFLRKYKSMKVPLEFFLEMMPRITPRYFSVSSDLLSQPSTVCITVAVVDGGLCTQMLKNLSVGENVALFVRKSNFHLPLRAKERPLVMIGAGTGVAPLIGFLHRRQAWKAKNHSLGKAILFFGCRRQNEDHIYHDFCAQCLTDGVLSDMDTAYSREQEQKVYVQHRLDHRRAEVWELIQQGANIYVCGEAKHMGHAVEAALLDMAEKEGGMSAEAAVAFLKQREDQEKYLKDLWTAS